MALTAGTRLGPYEVLSPLGAGGMGEVYRARDTRVDRAVALKVLPEEFLEGEEGKARFAREARALASLNHPNVAVLYSFEENGGRHLLTMELVEGVTLREKLASGPLSLAESLSLALQIAKGLSAAHEKGIVHRDLKPENLIVSKDGHLKILDFGLAKRTDVAAGEETSAPTESKHTEPGVVMGTVGYMSPEQVRGLPVDHRSDIFSFGAILYELLSGRKAFKRDTAADTMSAIMRDDPPELSGSGRNIPPALEQVVRHCLEKDRDNRFQSAKDVAFALSQASGPAATMTSGAQVKPPVASRNAKAVLALASLAFLTFSGILLFRLSKKPPAAPAGPKRIAVLPFENLGAAEDGYFADGMTDEVRSKLAGLSGLAVIASGSSGLYKATTKPPEQIAKELGVGYLLVGKVRWQKSGPSSRIRVSPELVDISAGVSPTTRWQEAFDAELADVFKVQSEISAKVAKSLDLVLSGKESGNLAARPTSNLAAYDAYLRAQKTDGLKARLAELERAVALDPGFALAWAQISEQHSYLYLNFDPSAEHAEVARTAAMRAVELAPSLPRAASSLATFHSTVKRDDARAREIVLRALEDAPRSVELLSHAASLQTSWEGRVAFFRRAEVLDPRSRLVLNGVSHGLLHLHREREARAVCDRGLAEFPDATGLIIGKVTSYLQEGDLTGARTVIAAAPNEPTRIAARFGVAYDLDWVLDDAHRDLLQRLKPTAFEDDRGTWGIVLAQAASRRADTAKVREYAEEARKAFAANVARDPHQGQTRALLGLSLAYLGRKEEAVREGERAVALAPISKTEEDEEGPYVLHLLARIHVLCGNHEKALDLLETLLKAPSHVTPGWLRIDPNFDPLRKNPRFEKLAAGK